MFAKKGCWYVFLFYQIGGPLPVFKFGIIPDLNIRIDSPGQTTSDELGRFLN